MRELAKLTIDDTCRLEVIATCGYVYILYRMDELSVIFFDGLRMYIILLL